MLFIAEGGGVGSKLIVQLGLEISVGLGVAGEGGGERDRGWPGRWWWWSGEGVDGGVQQPGCGSLECCVRGGQLVLRVVQGLSEGFVVCAGGFELGLCRLQLLLEVRGLGGDVGR